MQKFKFGASQTADPSERMQSGMICSRIGAAVPAESSSMSTAKAGARIALALIVLLILSTSFEARAQLERSGPKSEAAVYWVGHSLIEGKVQYDWGEHSLMTLVGRFAQARGLDYRMGDHTLWGASMAALWRGAPHGYKRDAGHMVEKREEFARTAGQYDTLVITEALPIEPNTRSEYSSYYLRQFYCTLKKANPAGRVYLYQTWVNFQGADSPAGLAAAHKFDWIAAMIAQRKVWETLADAAARTSVRAPGGWFDRLGWPSTDNAGCDAEDPIFIVPAGQAMIALSRLLGGNEAAADALLPSGERLKMADLFGNAYVDWPATWPLRKEDPAVDPAAVLRGLKLRDPSKPHDDIHLSPLGIYFVALVHFATIYRQSPLGLPYPAQVGEPLARLLQCVAWRTVVDDPRAGVQGSAYC